MLQSSDRLYPTNSGPPQRLSGKTAYDPLSGLSRFFEDLITFGVKTWPATNEPVTEAHYTGTAYDIADGYP